MKKILAPFTLFKHEKVYFFWISAVVIVIGISLIFPGYQSFFSKGQGVVFIIALLVPFLPELLLPFIIEKKKKAAVKYVAYKIISAILSVFVIITLFAILFKIESLAESTSIFWQLILIILSLLFVVYLYAVTKMDTHQDYFGLYDDVPYGIEENEKVSDLSKSASKRNSVGDVSL